MNMGYINYIRNMVGKKPIIACGASVLLINEKDEVLLQRRKDNNCWSNAGGTVELDEVVEHAAKRELYEETGIIAKRLILFGIFSGPQFHYTYPNGDELSIIDIVFICKEYEGIMKKQASEVKELKYFPINSLPENISPQSVPIFKKLIKYYIHPELWPINNEDL